MSSTLRPDTKPSKQVNAPPSWLLISATAPVNAANSRESVSAL
jgi:hypothetical protein